MRFHSGAVILLSALPLAAQRFTLKQALSAPFPSDLTASPAGGKLAWVFDENGARNIWVAEPPDYKGRRLTSFRADDGQEISQLVWTADARAILYVRGGDFEMRRDNPNPATSPDAVEQAIWIAPLSGEPARRIAEGSSPALSPKAARMVYVKTKQIWMTPLAGDDKPVQLIHAKGDLAELRWSPDGERVAFINNRTDHALIGVYDFQSKSLRYLDASVDQDSNPVWSPDGKQVAFVRVPVSSRAFSFGPVREAAEPWSIRIADAGSGVGRELWRAQTGAGSAFHAMVAQNQLLWGAGDRIVFPWERTGWMQLYSVAAAGAPGATPLTAGEFEVEHVALAQDGRYVLFSCNKDDSNRRHIWRTPVSGGAITRVTEGPGIEWSPVGTTSGDIAFLRSGNRDPARAAILLAGAVRDLTPEAIPSDFPTAAMVDPQAVNFTAADGMRIDAQIFLPRGAKTGDRRPAMIFLHGGSRRQMLLGWHYMDYYNHAYAMNQYLASLGYVVLAINYRSGIGYGMHFREALNYGATGASEFNDVLGAGLYLRSRADVDPKRIGLWGGSYGGYLTALGLARASDLFAVGVDFHGVHDWNNVIRNFVSAYDPAKDTNAARIAFESSPLSSMATWRSPVLLIHGDDDRNVPFHETALLVEALRKQHVPFEQIVFPDEIHGFLTHRRWLEAYQATQIFIDKYLRPGGPGLVGSHQ